MKVKNVKVLLFSHCLHSSLILQCFLMIVWCYHLLYLSNLNSTMLTKTHACQNCVLTLHGSKITCTCCSFHEPTLVLDFELFFYMDIFYFVPGLSFVLFLIPVFIPVPTIPLSLPKKSQ
jgi:hypothetical protein